MNKVDTSKFAITKNLHSKSLAEIAEIHKNPGFGVYFTDHMAHIQFSANEGIDEHLGVSTLNGSWHNFEIIPFEDLSISPAAAVFHYGQEAFEGIKAFKREDGSVWTFRADLNAKRFNESARRLGLPDLPEADFLASIAAVIQQDEHWVPRGEGEALYIRPFMFASEPFLGVRAAHQVDYYCILSPVGNYFGTPKPVNIWVETEYFRAGPGGTGFAKCGGNYAASLLPAQNAYEKGFSQVLYLDAKDGESIEELGGMSFFAVYADGKVVTPELNGQILNSVTRRSIIELLKSQGTIVNECKLSISELIADIKTGKVLEAFACGTAAVISPIGRLANENFDVQIGSPDCEGKLTKALRDEIVGIQRGLREDKFAWCTKIL